MLGIKQGYQAWSYNGEPMILKVRGADETRSADSHGRRDGTLAIKVLFTNREDTLQALRIAKKCSNGLKTQIVLMAAYTVPSRLPLDRPPVPVSVTQQILSGLVRESMDARAETSAEVYLCRDKLHTFLRVLEPQSTVIVGGGKRWWWPTPEGRLARQLRAAGHQVIFAAAR